MNVASFANAENLRQCNGECFAPEEKSLERNVSLPGEISKSGIQLISRRDAVYFSCSDTDIILHYILIILFILCLDSWNFSFDFVFQYVRTR